MPPINCLVCKTNDAHFYIHKRAFKLYRCTNCQLIFVYPIPPTTKQIYQEDYFSGAKDGYGYNNYEQDKKPMSKTFTEYLKIINEYTSAKGKLLDIGAANGFFLDLANNEGWDGIGIDISEYAATQARKNNVNVLHGTLDNVSLATNSFDVITLWDVLEHLPNPHKSVTQINKLIKKGGLVIISTPNSSSFFAKLTNKKWYSLLPPEHLFLYNPIALQKLLGEYGFKIVSIRNVGKLYTLPYVFNILYNWQKVSIWKKLIQLSNTSPFNNMSLPINLHDSMFVIAQKQ